jgi:hypothetical protein
MKKKPLQTFRRLLTKLLIWKMTKHRRFDTLMSKTHGCVNPCYLVFGVVSFQLRNGMFFQN